ncbi:MAG: o-succinylbenzoate synthase [Crocinitomicaceae bacterium]
MYQAKFNKLTLNFKTPSGTSRGVLTSKDSWILELWNKNNTSIIGKGEASIIKTLSPDWSDQYENKLAEVANEIDFFVANIESLAAFPSIQFAIETALQDLQSGGNYKIYEPEVNKISINGLIWMGSKEFMLKQVEEKIKAGFSTIKLKIGAIDFESELSILKYIRSHYSASEITLRVDANGAFDKNDALDKLKKLADFEIHSIEQPIKAGQWEMMKKLCEQTPLPIALDEELIGITEKTQKEKLLQKIKPQYIILKPSLIGGFAGTDEWIELAEKINIDWWVTSALESNIGLNAIAQYTALKNNPLPQGLGTGGLYTNNVNPFLTIKEGYLWL